MWPRRGCWTYFEFASLRVVELLKDVSVLCWHTLMILMNWRQLQLITFIVLVDNFFKHLAVRCEYQNVIGKVVSRMIIFRVEGQCPFTCLLGFR